MRRLFVPFLFDSNSHVVQNNGLAKMFADSLTGYPSIEQAIDAAKVMAMENPKGKVVILGSLMLIEPRKVEFAEKVYNENGELIA